MKLILWLERISKGSLYAAVLLLPLWFLPFTQNMVIYQKQTLLLVLVFVGLVAWLAKAVNQGEIRLRLSLIFIPAFLLLFGIPGCPRPQGAVSSALGPAGFLGACRAVCFGAGLRGVCLALCLCEIFCFQHHREQQ